LSATAAKEEFTAVSALTEGEEITEKMFHEEVFVCVCLID